MNSWNSKEGGGLVVVLEAWVEWERGWRKEKREGGVGVLEMEREEGERDREEGVWNWRLSFITALLTSAVILLRTLGLGVPVSKFQCR